MTCNHNIRKKSCSDNQNRKNQPMPAYFRKRPVGPVGQSLRQARMLHRRLGDQATDFIDENAGQSLKDGDHTAWRQWRRIARALKAVTG
jgi:hypothetical protein